MTGVELIAVALAAAAGELATGAVRDAYTVLRDALRRRLSGRSAAEQQLEIEDTDAEVWKARLGYDLVQCGADRDEEVLAAARRLLALTDPTNVQVDEYRVDVREASSVQLGDGTVHVDTNYGATAATMATHVTINYSDQPPIPPARPGAA